MPLDKNMSHDEMVKELMHSYYKNGKIGNTEPRGVEHALKIANAVAYNIERSKDVQEIEEGIKEMSLSDLLNQFESLYLNEQNEEINPEDTKFDRELLYGYIGGRLELAMDRDMVAKICHSGSNADEVDEVKEMPEIRKQLDEIPEEDLDELKHHLDMNQAEFDSLTRPELESYLVWIAAWNIFEDEEYSQLFENQDLEADYDELEKFVSNKEILYYQKARQVEDPEVISKGKFMQIARNLIDNDTPIHINKNIAPGKVLLTWIENGVMSAIILKGKEKNETDMSDMGQSPIKPVGVNKAKINEISDDTVYNAVAKSYKRTKASKENNSPDLIKNVMKFNSLNNKGLRREWRKAGLEDPRGMSTKQLSKKWDKEYVPVHAEYGKKVRDRINKSKLGETLNSFENFLNENSVSKQSYKGYTIYNTDKDTVFVNKLNGGYNVWSFGGVVKNPKNIIDNIKDYENEGGSTFVKTQDELKKELEEFGISESINEISNELVGKVHSQRKRNWIKDAEAVSQAMKKRFEKNPNYKPDKELQDLENKERKSWNKLMKNSELAKSKKLYKNEAKDWKSNDPMFTVEVEHPFISGIEVTKGYITYLLQFIAHNVPIVIADGSMFADGEWFEYPMLSRAVLDMRGNNDELKANWREFSTSVDFDKAIEDVKSKLTPFIQEVPDGTVKKTRDEAGNKIVVIPFSITDQYFPADRIYHKLTIIQESDGTYSYLETENLESGEGFTSAKEAIDDAISGQHALEDLDGFKLDAEVNMNDITAYFDNDEEIKGTFESKINEISDKLASKVVSKRMRARRAELDKLDDMAKDVDNARDAWMRTRPNTPEAIKAYDDYDAKRYNYEQALDDETMHKADKKANKLFKTVRKRGERLKRKGADYDYFHRLKRKGDKISNESLKEDMDDTKILSASYSFTGPDQYRPEEYGTCSFYKTPENKYYFIDERDEDKSELYNLAIDALYFADDYFNEIYDYFSWDEEFIELRRFMKEN